MIDLDNIRVVPKRKPLEDVPIIFVGDNVKIEFGEKDMTELMWCIVDAIVGDGKLAVRVNNIPLYTENHGYQYNNELTVNSDDIVEVMPINQIII